MISKRQAQVSGIMRKNFPNYTARKPSVSYLLAFISLFAKFHLKIIFHGMSCGGFRREIKKSILMIYCLNFLSLPAEASVFGRSELGKGCRLIN